MSEVKWIKITTSMFEDEKIDFIQSLPEADAIIVIWVRLLTLAGRCNAGGYIYLTENIPYTADMLAHKFRKPINTINLALETFKRLQMIEGDEKGLYLPNWDKHQNIDGLEKIKEQNRLRVAKHREAKKLITSNDNSNVTSNVTVTESNAIDKELEIDKELYIVETENIWSLYPSKQGKAVAIKKIPNLIKEFGYEQLERTVKRYIDYVELRRKTDFKDLKFQNGSTFFNKGYVDYLDENYQEEAAATKRNWWDDIDS